MKAPIFETEYENERRTKAIEHQNGIETFKVLARISAILDLYGSADLGLSKNGNSLGKMIDEAIKRQETKEPGRFVPTPQELEYFSNMGKNGTT